MLTRDLKSVGNKWKRTLSNFEQRALAMSRDVVVANPTLTSLTDNHI